MVCSREGRVIVINRSSKVTDEGDLRDRYHQVLRAVSSILGPPEQPSIAKLTDLRPWNSKMIGLGAYN